MNWTSDRDPANSRRDSLRLLVGDIDADEPLLTDEEIDYYLTLSTNDFLVASLLCNALCGVMAREVDRKIGPLRERAELKFDHYAYLAKQFWQMAAGEGPGGVAGIGTAPPMVDAAAGTGVDPFFTRVYPR